MTLWMGPKPENGLSRLTPAWSLRATRRSSNSGAKNSRKKLLKGNTKSPECAVDDSGVRSRFLHFGFFRFYIIARSAQFVHEIRTFLTALSGFSRKRHQNEPKVTTLP